jgi:hypothetical protein
VAAGAEAAAYFREAARLAGHAGDSLRVGTALLNLSDAVTWTDPAAGAAAARDAAARLRQAGARDHLAYAVGNLAQALLMLGNWDSEATAIAAKLGCRPLLDRAATFTAAGTSLAGV